MSFSRRYRRSRRPRWSLDNVAIALMAGLALIAALLIILGDHATARVQEFSWQEHTVGADNIAFSVTFSRPMNPDSVEANLEITPPIPGRVSWAGRRMAYTLDIPIPYGEQFAVDIPEARDRFSQTGDAIQFEAFTGRFQSRDRAMAYIGTEGDETDRLVLVNFSQGDEPVILTPKTLTVLSFEPYPLGDRLLFSAVAADVSESGPQSPGLYTVATGLSPNPPEQPISENRAVAVSTSPAGTIDSVLDSDEYQNLAFDLSPDGQLIVVQRIHQQDPTDFGPWVIRDGREPRPLETESGGEFIIGPDSQSLLMLQGQGTAIIPLDEEKAGAASTQQEPLDFLPEFGRVFDLNTDGTAAAMVNFNQDDPERRFTESLVLVKNQGDEIELLNVTGSISDARFAPTGKILYVLASELLPGEAYQEEPFLAAINLETQETLTLLTLPAQYRASMSISPDGLAALVEIASPDMEGPAAETASTVLLPLFETTEERINGIPAKLPPQMLPYAGRLPTWLP